MAMINEHCLYATPQLTTAQNDLDVYKFVV